MDYLLPQAILKESWELMKSKFGFFLIGINFIFCIFLGIISLVLKIIIFGPAAMLLHSPGIAMGLIVFILALLFVEVLILFVIVEQFVVLVYLDRFFKDPATVYQFNFFKEEKERFVLYIKACLSALVKICVGLLMFVWPGIQALLKYVFVGPMAVFKYNASASSDEFLEKSEAMATPHVWRIGGFFLLLFVLTLVVDVLLGRVIAQLVLLPLILTFFTLSIVLYYRSLSSASVAE